VSDVGFSSLATLKAHVMPLSQAADTDYDARLTSIGKGVVAQFEGHCGRRFKRTAGATYQAPAERGFFVLERYPVEQITDIDVRIGAASTWTEQALTAVDQLVNDAGLVLLLAPLGTTRDRVRFTYDGGYFWNTSEGSPDAQPSGSTALPDDLFQAWILQVKHVLAQANILATQIADKPGATPALAALELLPDVVTRLRRFIRYDML
jgi:hypothetical protein